jgi:hypothetical protein
VHRTCAPAARGADGLLGAGHQQEAHNVEVAAPHSGLQWRLAVCVLKLVHACALLERAELVELDAALQVRSAPGENSHGKLEARTLKGGFNSFALPNT